MSLGILHHGLTDQGFMCDGQQQSVTDLDRYFATDLLVFTKSSKHLGQSSLYAPIHFTKSRPRTAQTNNLKYLSFSRWFFLQNYRILSLFFYRKQSKRTGQI